MEDVFFLFVLVVVLGAVFGERIGSILVLLVFICLLLVVFDHDYYVSCANGGQSYLRCVYERVVKP